MTRSDPTPPQRQRWSLGDIPWGDVDRAAVAANEELFYLVAAASFLESATDLYTRSIVERFSNDEEMTGWLGRHWQNEELQHGKALRRYVETGWPDFDWQENFDAFIAEFSDLCTAELLEPMASLEMASRCVVEMGTATYYTALGRLSPEPVLSLLARHIADDEVRHYKYFLRHFNRFREVERPGRAAILGALWRRVKLIDGSDSAIVLRRLYTTRHPDGSVDGPDYARTRQRCRQLARQHFPREMMVKMLLRPLGLGARTEQIALPIADALIRIVA